MKHHNLPEYFMIILFFTLVLTHIGSISVATCIPNETKIPYMDNFLRWLDFTNNGQQSFCVDQYLQEIYFDNFLVDLYL